MYPSRPHYQYIHTYLPQRHERPDPQHERRRVLPEPGLLDRPQECAALAAADAFGHHRSGLTSVRPVFWCDGDGPSNQFSKWTPPGRAACIMLARSRQQAEGPHGPPATVRPSAPGAQSSPGALNPPPSIHYRSIGTRRRQSSSAAAESTDFVIEPAGRRLWPKQSYIGVRRERACNGSPRLASARRLQHKQQTKPRAPRVAAHNTTHTQILINPHDPMLDTHALRDRRPPHHSFTPSTGRQSVGMKRLLLARKGRLLPLAAARARVRGDDGMIG